MGGLVGRCGHCLLSLPSCTPWAPQKLHALFGQIPSGLHKFPPPGQHQHVRSATLSIVIGTWERALDLWALMSAEAAIHLPPWHLLGMALPHSGVLGQGSSSGEHSRSSSLSIWAASTFPPWPQPIGLHLWHVFSLPHWQGNQ